VGTEVMVTGSVVWLQAVTLTGRSSLAQCESWRRSVRMWCWPSALAPATTSSPYSCRARDVCLPVTTAVSTGCWNAGGCRRDASRRCARASRRPPGGIWEFSRYSLSPSSSSPGPSKHPQYVTSAVMTLVCRQLVRYRRHFSSLRYC